MRPLWQLWEGVLSIQECEEFKKICYDTVQFSDATVFSSDDYKPRLDIRDTKVGFINSEKIHNLVKHYLLEANRAVFNFDVNYLPAIQFGEYSENSFYDWHHDINWQADSMYDRKLSISIQLSDPSEYEGGEFQFQNIESPVNFRTQGSVLVFASHQVHRVTKVEKGVRNSLVGWMEGPRWR